MDQELNFEPSERNANNREMVLNYSPGIELYF